jgi:hypothetical protein
LALQVSLTSREPLLLRHFQRFVVLELMAASARSGGEVVRAKGLIYSAERPSCRLVLQLSGKHRLDLYSDGPWRGEPLVELVLIGRALNAHALRARFDAAIVRDWAATRVLPALSCAEAEVKARLEAAVRGDTRLRLLTDAEHEAQAVLFGMADSPLHGIFESELNAALLSLLNASGVVLGLPYATVHGVAYVQLLVGGGGEGVGEGRVGVEAQWAAVDAAVASVRREFFKGVSNCKCNF